MEIRDAISVTTAFHPSDTTLKRHYISLSLSCGIILDSRGRTKKRKEKRERYMKRLETAKEIHRDCNFKYRIDFLFSSFFLPFFLFFFYLIVTNKVLNTRIRIKGTTRFQDIIASLSLFTSFPERERCDSLLNVRAT